MIYPKELDFIFTLQKLCFYINFDLGSLPLFTYNNNYILHEPAMVLEYKFLLFLITTN